MEFNKEDWQFIFSCLYAKEYDSETLKNKTKIDKVLYYRKIFFILNQIDPHLYENIPSTAIPEIIKISQRTVEATKINEHLIMDGILQAITRENIRLDNNESSFMELFSVKTDEKSRNNLIKLIYNKNKNLLSDWKDKQIVVNHNDAYDFVGRLAQITAKKQKTTMEMPDFILNKIEQEKHLFDIANYNWNYINLYLKGLSFCKKENQQHFIEYQDKKFKNEPKYQAWKETLNLPTATNEDEQFTARETITIQKSLKFSLLSVFLNSNDPLIAKSKNANANRYNSFLSKGFIFLVKHLHPNITSNEFFGKDDKTLVTPEKTYSISFKVDTNLSFEKFQDLTNKANQNLEDLKKNITFLKKAITEVPKFKEILLNEIEETESLSRSINNNVLEKLYNMANAFYAKSKIDKILHSTNVDNNDVDNTSSSQFKI